MNPQQKAAIYYINGPLLILGGAGSGKTSLLVHKIAWLIKECNVLPSHIVALTSSQRAARILRAQVTDRLNGQRIDGLTTGTLHMFGLTILREHQTELGYRPGFSIYNNLESRMLLEQLLRTRWTELTVTADTAQRLISQHKRTLRNPTLVNNLSLTHEHFDPQIYTDYESKLATYNAIDLDDLITKPAHLLARYPDVLAYWRERIHYLLVDEYEELTPHEHEFIRLLTENYCRLTAAGDDDQSILGKIDAHPTGFHRLRQDVSTLKVIRLEQNYRSTGRILKSASALITHNRCASGINLWGDRDYGEPIKLIKARNEEHEAECVVTALMEHKSKKSADYRDYAILLPDISGIELFERALRTQRIPYCLGQGPFFLDQPEVKDILTYLQLISNPSDDNAFRHVLNTPRRSIDRATVDELDRHAERLGVSYLTAALDPAFNPQTSPEGVEALRAFASWLQRIIERAPHSDPIMLICSLIAELHYENWLRDTYNDTKIAEHKMEKVMQFIGKLQRQARKHNGYTLNQLLKDLSPISLFGDNNDYFGDSVSLMTLTAAKGLEFPYVFITGLEENRLPYSDENDFRVQECRRQLYVGMMRARETLTLSYAERRNRGGGISVCQPSRFLTELSQNDILQERELNRDSSSPIGRVEAYLAHLRSISHRI